MKHAAYGLLAAFLAQGVYGAIPTTASGWYTPSEWRPVELEASYERGGVTYGCAINSDGEIIWGEGKINDPLVKYALETAVEAWWNTKRNDQKFEKLGEELHNLTSKDGIHIRNENTGQEFTIKFGGSIATAASGSDGDIPATSDAEDPADKASLDWTSGGKLEVRGWSSQNASGDFWSSFSDPVGIPVRTANGAAMAYRNWYGVDRLSLMPDGTTHKLELKGWRSEGSSTMTPLAEAIKKTTKGTFDDYELVVRNSSKGLNYVSLGTLDVDLEVDGKSVVTNSNGVTLYGYDSAEESSDVETPYLPFADGREHLAWQSVLDFFNTGLFNLTSDGKVNLKGVSAGDEDDLRVMTVSASDGGAAITSSSISTMIDTPLGMDEGKITVTGWDNATPSAGSTLAESLTSGSGYVNDPSRSTSLLARTSSGGVSYMAIGSLPSAPGPDGKSIVTNSTGTAINGYGDAEPGAVAYKTADGLEWRVPEDVTSVDGSSITTNSEDGASSSGVASLYGWSNASAEDFPRRGSDGHLEWKSPGDLVDGASIAWAEVDGGKKFEVRDAHVYAGQHSRHYFGTSNDKTAALGWHELPNVTTNRVEGDNVTIASTVDDQDPGIKRLGLVGWNRSWGGDPLFVVNAGGAVGYIPLPALTNLAACACTNKWNAMLDWIADGELNGEDGITFTDSTLDQYLYGTLGYVYSTTADNLHFDNDGENVQASFTAPENWADGDSVELADGAYQVAGWADASACDASVSAMLSQPSGSDATTHLFLAKKTDSGELHYVSIGDGIQSGAAVDDTTITTNTAHGAVTSGEASIYGWSGAASDTYLSKNEGGNLEWRKIDAVPGVDEASVVTNASKQLTLNGYAAAESGAIPQKTAQGLSWLKASSATNLILAGAGINITDNGGGAITISAQSYESGSGGDSTKSLTVVTDVRYDETSHKFQKKTRTLTFKGSLGSESAWTDVFEAVSHKSEHGVE